MSSIQISSTRSLITSRSRWFITAVIVVGVVIVAAWATRGRWLQFVASGGDANSSPTPDSSVAAEEHGHEHNHDHAGHSEASSIELSDKALKNIGFQPVTVELGPFERTVTLPAMVVEQPGRTQIRISAPMGGVITKIHAVAGEAVEPGSPMFEVRLTHEELVTAQRDYLQAAESLDVVNREIARLESLGEGVIAGKRVLEQKYEKQKLEAALRAHEQALLLHGLNEEQIQEILKNRKLLGSLTIRAPDDNRADENCPAEHLYQVQNLPVSPGQQIEAGQELCVLGDHCELYVEGKAFEDDAARLRQAAREGWNVSGTLMVGDQQTEMVEGLKLLYVSGSIDPESRAFLFYLRLPNGIVLDQQPAPDRRYIEWQFKPGQRMQLRIPTEEWKDRIVLPVDSVVEEGAEMYVYRQNGDHFDRVPVHVEYHGRDSVVVANDGALFPGDIVAGRGAYQIHLALKNKSGGGIDPHAGHNH